MDKTNIRQIGRYELLDVIGQGGMGIVYRAVDASIGRTVAIKMLHGAYAEDKDLLARFHREVRFTANLQHKNIVTVYALDDFEGFPYMVMEHLEGQSIGEMITSHRPLHLVEKMGLICQVCEGLHYAHERSVIHRDIKPANILVLKDGTAKIVDFGIARVGMSESITRTGQVIGSVFYMSPEQISGAAVDGRTDIYSAAVTLYQFLAGELPFKGTDGDPHSTLVKILNDPVPSLGRYLTDFPIALDEILSKAMAKNPEERYQSAEDFGYDLSRLQENLKQGMTEQYLSHAKTAIDRKDWELARQQLQEVLKFEKRNNEATELLRFVRQEIQRQQRSVQIMQLRSQAQIALTGLQYEEALECVEQALRLDPDEPELIALSASIKAQVERVRELAEALRRGQAALYAGDLNEAKIAVREALNIEQNHTEARALEGLIDKELEERARRANFQGFVEEARREISNRNFLSALQSLQKAQAIDPGDSNIRELLSWAARGHEQEKLRSELQKCTNEIGQLLSENRYAEALEACQASLQRFPDEPSLQKLQQIANHQNDLVLRRRAVDEASVEARRLAEADKNDEAIEVLEQALRSFPNEPNLETLLALTRAESEQRRLEKEERERQREVLAAEQLSTSIGTDRQEDLEHLKALQEGLARNLPIPKLRILAGRVVDSGKILEANSQESRQYSAALTEFKLRSTKWECDCKDLDEIGGSIREAKGGVAVDSLLDQARSIAEQHGKDEEIRGRYTKIREFAEEFKSRREAVSKQVSRLLISMQANQNLDNLVSTEGKVQEVSASWLEDAFIRNLVDQASARVEEARRQREQILQELGQLADSLLAARSAGQIRLLEEQANMVSADSDDAEIEKAIRGLYTIAREKIAQIEDVVTQLRDLSARAPAAQTLAEIDNCDSLALKLASEASDSEEANDLLRRIRHSVEEGKKEYRRIEISLERLLEGSTKAAGPAELELILARHRDVLKRFRDDAHFRELEMRLEAAVSERRAYLAEASSPEELSEEDELADLNLTQIDNDRGGTHEAAEIEVKVSAQSQKMSRGKVLRLAFLGAGMVGAITLAAIFAAPRTVTISTVPARADVKVDGHLCGSPCTLKLRPGKHDLLATQTGFEDLHKTIAIPWFGAEVPSVVLSELPHASSKPASSQPIEPTVNPSESNVSPAKDSRITVNTSVQDAIVFVDGSPVGKTGANGKYQFSTTAGSHQIRVEKRDYEKVLPQTILADEKGLAVATFDLRSSKQASISGTGTNSSGVASNGAKPALIQNSIVPSAPVDTFIVIQAPAGAEIHIDQQVEGHSTGSPFKSRVQPGQRTVEVFLPGYQPFSKTLSVTAGNQEELIASLTPLSANAPSKLPSPTPTSGVSEDDRKQIQQLLDRYAEGYSQKNVKLIQEQWPSIHPDEVKKIKDFFKLAKSVSMKLSLTDAVPAGKRVTVDCTQTFVADLDGKRESHTDSMTLYVVKQGNIWVIDFIPKS